MRTMFKKLRELRALAAVVVFSPLSMPVWAVPNSVSFDNPAKPSVVDNTLIEGDWAFQLIDDASVSDKGTFSINDNGVSDLGTDPDLYLIATGNLNDTDGILATPHTDTDGFSLTSLAIAKGLFGEAGITFRGLLNGQVVAVQSVVTTNTSQVVNFTGAGWGALDAIRIETSTSHPDFDVEIDDMIVAAPVAADVSITPSTLDLAEGDSGSTAMNFTVTRSGTTTEGSVVAYSVTGSGAAPATASDFGGTLPSGIVLFLPSEVSKTITISVSGDAAPEPNETYNVTLTNVTGANVVAGVAQGTIQNDDPFPTVALATNTLSRAEDQPGLFSFSVTRSGDTSVSSSVAYAVTGSGASPVVTADFSGGVLPSGTVSFAAGETSKTIDFGAAMDSVIEPDESFTLTLSTPVNASLGTSTALGTIENDDFPQITAVSIPDVTMYPGDVVTVTINVVNDAGDTYTNVSGQISGLSLSNLVRVDSTTYSAEFTVPLSSSGVGAAQDHPVSVRIDSSSGVPSALYTTPINQANDPIIAGEVKAIPLLPWPWMLMLGAALAMMVRRKL